MRMNETAPSFLLYDQLSILLIVLVIFFSFSNFSTIFLEHKCIELQIYATGDHINTVQCLKTSSLYQEFVSVTY